MIQINEEVINKINNQLQELGLRYEQGIFVQPNYIPTNIKEPVIYTKYSTGGTSGGSCYNGDEDNDYPQRYNNDEPKNKWIVLDLLLKEICPQITYLLYKEIESTIKTNEDTDFEYYGNSTDWKVEYIRISDILKILNQK